MAELLHSRITEQILGAAFEVHNGLGPGFLETIYEEAMCHERLQYQRQVHIPIHYKNAEVGTHVLSYLAASTRSVALLINFGQPSVAFRRIVRQQRTP